MSTMNKWIFLLLVIILSSKQQTTSLPVGDASRHRIDKRGMRDFDLNAMPSHSDESPSYLTTPASQGQTTITTPPSLDKQLGAPSKQRRRVLDEQQKKQKSFSSLLSAKARLKRAREGKKDQQFEYGRNQVPNKQITNEQWLDRKRKVDRECTARYLAKPEKREKYRADRRRNYARIKEQRLLGTISEKDQERYERRLKRARERYAAQRGTLQKPAGPMKGQSSDDRLKG